MTTIVEMKNINKDFSKGQVKTTALSDISLTIKEGEFISISGPSGCGKSTLLSILGLLDTPTDGDYTLAGTDTRGMDVDQRSQVRNLHIGYVFQSFNLIDNLTVHQNVGLPLEHRGTPKDEIDKLVNIQLSAVNMENRIHHKPNQLSGGQQQRVAIARSLVGKPDLLLVDEPTGNLDSENGDAVMHILKQLNAQGATIVMVTHDERYSHMAQRQIRLLDGKILVERLAEDA
jgi:putative ABC transport system ATP-binding protein